MAAVWKITTREVYFAIYEQHKADLQVFGSCTDMEGRLGKGEPYILTEWGFHGDDGALIRSERRVEECTYFIARHLRIIE